MRTSDAIVIGGGILGTATAYYLAKGGLRVTLMEKDYLCAGSTGRCIGGIRQQFTTETTIRVAMESVKLFSQMAEELGHDVEWHPGGYLFLAHSELRKEGYLEAIPLQNRLGLDVAFIQPSDVKEIVPDLNCDGLLGAAYCTTDGQANPFHVVRAYADAIRSSGGEILLRTPVVEIDTSGSKVSSVSTADGLQYFAPVVINAAGPFAKEIGQMVGLEVPCEPERHEALVTERCERLFDPMIVDYRPDGCYFNQTISTNQLIGCYTPDPRIEGTRVDSTLEFMKEMPRRMMRLLPSLQDVKVIRQWSGSYTMTPDGSPIVGLTPLEGFYLAVGMSGHGFMLGPALGRLLAEIIVNGTPSIRIDELAWGRDFQTTEVFK